MSAPLVNELRNSSSEGVPTRHAAIRAALNALGDAFGGPTGEARRAWGAALVRAFVAKLLSARLRNALHHQVVGADEVFLAGALSIHRSAHEKRFDLGPARGGVGLPGVVLSQRDRLAGRSS